MYWMLNKRNWICCNCEYFLLWFHHFNHIMLWPYFFFVHYAILPSTGNSWVKTTTTKYMFCMSLFNNFMKLSNVTMQIIQIIILIITVKKSDLIHLFFYSLSVICLSNILLSISDSSFLIWALVKIDLYLNKCISNKLNYIYIKSMPKLWLASGQIECI